MNANKQEIFIEPIDVGTMYLSPDEKQEITHIHIKLSKPFPKKEEAKKLVNRWLSQPALLDALQALMKHIDDGDLVRNTNNDGASDWAIKMLPLMQTLTGAKAAIELAKKT